MIIFCLFVVYKNENSFCPERYQEKVSPATDGASFSVTLISLAAFTTASSVATLHFGCYGVESQSQVTLAHVVNKRPHALRSRWTEYSYLITGVPAGSVQASTPIAPAKDCQEQKGVKVVKPKDFASAAPSGTDKSVPSATSPILHEAECRQFRESAVKKG